MSRYLGDYCDPISISIPNWLKDGVRAAFEKNEFTDLQGKFFKCSRKNPDITRKGHLNNYSFPSLLTDINEIRDNKLSNKKYGIVTESALRRAFGDKQKTKKNPIKKDLLDLLCLYAFRIDWTCCIASGKSTESEDYYKNKLKISSAVINSKETTTSEEIYATHKKLLDYKNNDEIPKGRIEAEKAFSNLGYTPLIIKDLFRFNILSNLRGRVTDVIESYNGPPSDELKAVFQLHLVECEVKDAYENRSDIIAFKDHLKSAQKHLTSVPLLHQSSESFYYWSGRYYLESWWMTKDTNNVSNLRRALEYFNKAIDEKPGGWWLLAYVCITKRVLGQEYLEELSACKGSLKKRREDHPQLVSAKIYLIIAQIMEDDHLKKNNLSALLIQIDRPKSITDFEDTVKHYIELIFFNQQELSLKYINIIENWLST